MTESNALNELYPHTYTYKNKYGHKEEYPSTNVHTYQHGGVRRNVQVGLRHLQGTPTYTSPPTDTALHATPEAFRNDEVIDAARANAADDSCSPDDESAFCHIPFKPDAGTFEPSKVGVIFFGGAFVDPRSYAPLAKTMAERYGIPVVIPIFSMDIALGFGRCESGRVPIAQAQFQEVEKWVLAGHSLGGLAATADAWTAMSDSNSTTDFDTFGGLALLGADIQNVGCGPTDFSNTNFPMALSSATEDEVLNQTRYDENLRLSSNATFYVQVFGGNHAQYGSYDDSGRVLALGPTQADGTPLIPPLVQWDTSTVAIFHVVSRSGVRLPQKLNVTDTPTGMPSDASAYPTGSPIATLKPVTGVPSVAVPNTASPVRVPTTRITNPPTLICPENPRDSAASSYSLAPWIIPFLLLIVFRR